MVQKGVAHLKKMSRVYRQKIILVSSATFPAYFLKEKSLLEEAAIKRNVHWMRTLFKRKNRTNTCNSEVDYVGEEPYSEVTEVYNETMKKVFRTNR